MKLEIVILNGHECSEPTTRGWNSSTEHKNLRWKNIWKVQPDLFSIINQIFAPILGRFPLDPVCLLPKTLMLDIAWSMVWMASALATKKTNSTQEIFNPKKTPWNMFFFHMQHVLLQHKMVIVGKELEHSHFYVYLSEIPWWTIELPFWHPRMLKGRESATISISAQFWGYMWFHQPDCSFKS